MRSWKGIYTIGEKAFFKKVVRFLSGILRQSCAVFKEMTLIFHRFPVWRQEHRSCKDMEVPVRSSR